MSAVALVNRLHSLDISISVLEVCIDRIQTIYYSVYIHKEYSQWSLYMHFWSTACSRLHSGCCFCSALFHLNVGHLLKVQVFEVVSTSILAFTVTGAHQVGETGAGVMLPFPWIGHLQVRKEGGGIIWQFKSFISWQVELQIFKNLKIRMWS